MCSKSKRRCSSPACTWRKASRTIHDGALYYIANSQWDRFDAEGNLPAADQLEAPRIMRLPLD